MYSSSEWMAGGTRPTHAGGDRFPFARPANDRFAFVRSADDRFPFARPADERVGRVPPAILPGPGMFL